MLSKNILYSLLIISLYMLICSLIFNDNKKVINTYQEKQINLKQNTETIGYIYIDKIKLQQPLYQIESKKNNVDQNITILKESILPDKKDSIMFIAAHSGDSKVSYFEHLDELEKNDVVKINYLNKEYFYQVTSIWEEEKNGYIHVNKENKKQLVLTTCSPTHKNKQLIISSKIME